VSPDTTPAAFRALLVLERAGNRREIGAAGSGSPIGPAAEATGDRALASAGVPAARRDGCSDGAGLDSERLVCSMGV
jgi:hypothetical protein